MKNFRCFYIALMFGFLLGVQNGYITLWQDGNSTALQVFPYRAEMLPEADYLALKNGIPIESEEELNRLLEDYLS